MKDKDWENWLTGREGTLYGDMKRETMKDTNPPIKTNFPKIRTTTVNTNSVNNSSSYTTRTKEDTHFGQEDFIANIIFFGILGIITYAWFSNPEISLEWYWYFGVSIVISYVVVWLLKNPFRILLTLMRLAIKFILYIVVIGIVISLLFYFFSK
ncbi:MAG: hypothetical protein V7719_15235 [Psychroserpens sp.]|uniref:hypothetical protein n=1 Tax=Psychroserpens sp. TaxID=2020870 RepID=UPI003001ADE6